MTSSIRWTLCAALATPALAQQEAATLEERLAVQERELAELREAFESSRVGRSGFDNGFFVESADGQSRLRFGALLQVNALAFERGLDARDSQFDLRRMRLEFEGEIEKRWLFNLEPFFSESEVELEEAWLGARLCADSTLMLGRMKEPFSLEEMSSRKHWDFAEFSLLNQLVPAEDTGVTVLGKCVDERLEYGVALYNGTGGDELNEDKDVAARLVWHTPRGLQFGAAATVGDADQAIDGEVLKTETRQPFITFEPGSEIDGERTRLGLESAWISGPFGLFAEAMQVEQDVLGAGGDANVAYSGWYVAGSWVLSGEDKTFKGVRPANAVGHGGCGAWQLAARVSQLELDDDLVSAGLVLPASFTDSVTSYDLGLNWYATYNARVRLHVVHTEYSDRIAIGGDNLDSEDALLVQFQLGF